jgi:ABC-type bacteriocin/lantibiotic exporter with double-glycine peptidase domain
MKILQFPRARQFCSYDCWASAFQAILAYYDIDVKWRTVIKRVKTTKKWTNIEDIIAVAESYGLQYISKTMTITEIKSYINKEIPVLVVLQARTLKNNINRETDWDDGHYVIAIGYDDDNLYFEDPGNFKRTFLWYDEFKKRWHDIGKNGNIYDHHGIAFFWPKLNFKIEDFEHMD